MSIKKLRLKIQEEAKELARLIELQSFDNLLKNPCTRCERAEATYFTDDYAYCADCEGYLEALGETEYERSLEE